MHYRTHKMILVVGVTFLLLGAGVVLGINVNQETQLNSVKEQPGFNPLGLAWSDNFDSYVAGSALHGQGGWYGWDNVSGVTGYVSNAQARSAPNSVEIKWFTTVAADMVHEYSGVNSGTWIYKAWQYVPSTMTGTQFFILMNKYIPATTHNIQDWSLQLEISATGGYIRDFNNVAATRPLITNTWVEIRVVIDFEADLQTVYYNNVQFISKSWKNGVSSGGQKNLACVDLYAGDTTSTSVYYDDLSLRPPAPPLTCDANGPYTGLTGQAVQFNGSASGGTPPYTWAWTFGDGGTAAVQNPPYVYSTAGVYNVTLTVTDDEGQIASDTTKATITNPPEPEITIGAITSGLGKVNAEIKNIGAAEATNVNWKIELTGGLILLGKTSTGSIPTIAAGGQSTVTSKFILGLGKTVVKVTADTATKSVNATVLLIFIKI